MYDVIALGELLVDFTNNGTSDQGNMLFEANPGGAPCNVLAMLAKLGKKTAFIGKVGNDMFGAMLKETIERVGISSKELKVDKNVNTTLAFVHTFPDGDRAFSFYRNPGADMMLTKDEVQKELIESSRIFHFGTLSSTHEGVRESTRHAIELATEAGCIITFDPNLRPPLLKSLDDARAEIQYGMSKFDEAHEKGLIDKVLTTNLVYQPEEVLSRDYYVSVDMSKYIALLIDTLNHDQSISGLLNPAERINAILEKYGQR